MGANFKTLDLLEFCLENLVPFIQPAGSLRGLIKPDLLAQYTEGFLECVQSVFEELNVNESGTRGFNFPRNSHVLGNERAVSGQICFDLSDPKNVPPTPVSLKIIQNFG